MRTMNALLSIIIPAYNTAKTLEGAVRSVLQQQFHDIQVVVVDDGSTDDTLKVAQQMAQADSRVMVLSQKNSGAYAARLAGVASTDSKYIAFVDADDAIEPIMYTKMIHLAEEHDLDVVECMACGEKTTGEVELFLTKEDVLQKYSIPSIVEARGSSFVWNKLYNRRVWNVQARTRNILMFEDLDINIQVFYLVKRLAVLHEGLYRYQVNEMSSVRNFKPKNIDDFCEAIQIRKEFISRYDGYSLGSVENAFWVCKNARNIFFSLAVAKGDMRGKLREAERIINLPDLKSALLQIKKDCGKWERWVMFFSFVKLFGLRISLWAIRFAKRAQGYIRCENS